MAVTTYDAIANLASTIGTQMSAVSSGLSGNVSAISSISSGLSGNNIAISSISSGLSGNNIAISSISSGLSGNVSAISSISSGLSGNVSAISSISSGLSDQSTKPLVISPFTLAALPSASTNTDRIIVVTDATGGSKICQSDGTNWVLINTTTTVS